MKESSAYNHDYTAVRDISEIENIPKLIIHSEEDRAVPFERGIRIYDAAEEPKEFWKTETKHIKTLEDLPSALIEKMEGLIE